jgi:hypothetical protein
VVFKYYLSYNDANIFYPILIIKTVYYLSIAEAKQRCNTEALQHKHHDKNSEVHKFLKLLSIANKIYYGKKL